MSANGRKSEERLKETATFTSVRPALQLPLNSLRSRRNLLLATSRKGQLNLLQENHSADPAAVYRVPIQKNYTLPTTASGGTKMTIRSHRGVFTSESHGNTYKHALLNIVMQQNVLQNAVVLGEPNDVILYNTE